MKLKEAARKSSRRANEGSPVQQVLNLAEKNRIMINADDLAWFMAFTDAQNATSSGIKDLARMFYEGGYEPLKGNPRRMQEFIETYLEDDREEGMKQLMSELGDFFK